MMNSPLVSVVIPCYNHEQFIQDSIQSVIDQTYQNIELIIIDDGSKDRSVEKIQQMISHCEQRFTRFEFRSRPNKGLSATLNESLEWCRGEFYSAIASDDMIYKEKTELQINYFLFIKNKNIVGVFGGYNLVDEKNKIISKKVNKERIYNFNDLFMHNFNLPAPTALLKLKAVKDTGGYNESLKIEDWYMWLKLTENGAELVYLSNILVKYRSHESNTSKNIIMMNQERKKVIDLFSKQPNYHLAQSKVDWLTVTDYLYISRSQAITQVFNLLVGKPLKVLSKDFLRFLYHFIKVGK